MTGPSTKRYTEIPISPFSGWDKVSQIEGILTEHDYGMVQRSATLTDAMMRDDRISGVLNTRIGSLLASELDIGPAGSSNKARKVAAEIGGEGEDPGIWDTMFPDSTTYAILKYARMLGIVCGEIIWTCEGTKRWTPRLRYWHPQFLYFDWASFRWMLTTAEGTIPLPNVDEHPHGDGHWFVWAPYGYQYGWLSGLIRSLALKYLGRGWNYRDWSRYNERHGLPILGLSMPAQADKEIKAMVLQAVGNIGSETVIPLPVNEDGTKKYDLRVIEATARTYESFEKFKAQIDTDTAINIIGQNLTTEVKEGSRAAAQIQNQVRIDKRREDATLAKAYRNQVLWWYAAHNYGDPELAPIPTYQVEPPEDEVSMGNKLKALGDGLQAMETGAPGHVNIIEVIDRAGVPRFSEEEIAANEAIRAERRAEMFAATQQQQGQDAGPGETAPGKKPPFPPAAAAGDDDKKALGSLAPVKTYAFQGLQISVEHPAGSHRTWHERNPDGTQNIGSTKMLHDYGYVEGYLSGDEEELDVYIGPNEAAAYAYVVHQKKAPDFKVHDEDKVFLGFESADAAMNAYRAHRNDGDRAIGGMSTVPIDVFKARLRRRLPHATSKIRATAMQNTVDALMALAAAPPAIALAAKRRPANNNRYPDQVERRAIVLAVRALAPDVAGLGAEIEKATDLRDLRRRVVEYYREKMDPATLAEIVRKTNMLTHMAGRFTAQRQI